ncbi:MAG: hypothetical protein U1C51_07450 [Candidatus Izemoplasmatales bacterium]|jgi:hypothetical protein|nr:hypothetical protein [bacterium]MDZ4197059.1 hypothetical protein [Candidatus Izemoplasmatales bacterium]
MKKLVNVLGQLAGFLTVTLLAFLIVSTVFDFGVPAQIMTLLSTIAQYAIYVVLGLSGLELVAGKRLFALIYFILLAIVVIFNLFHDIWTQLIGLI